MQNGIFSTAVPQPNVEYAVKYNKMATCKPG